MNNLRLCCIALATLAACDGNGNATITPGPCDKPFSACGGSVVGRWKFANSCGSSAGVACPGVATTANGSFFITFDAGATYGIDTTGYTVTNRFPATCFAPDAGPIGSCAELSQRLAAVGGSCTGGGTADCVCTYNPMAGMGTSGTWSVAGTTLTLKATSPMQMVTYDYCVDGDNLKLQYTTQVNTFARQ